MSFLLDTDTCSAYLKNDQRVVGKVMLHFGGLHVSVVSVGELLTWARRAKAPPARLQGVRDFLKAAMIHEIDVTVAEKFGEIRAGLLDQGVAVGEVDLLNAAVALAQNLTMVTHNTRDYASIPGLTLEDWMSP
jgi:predicted nucleic acid-binding protein